MRRLRPRGRGERHAVDRLDRSRRSRELRGCLLPGMRVSSAARAVVGDLLRLRPRIARRSAGREGRLALLRRRHGRAPPVLPVVPLTAGASRPGRQSLGSTRDRLRPSRESPRERCASHSHGPESSPGDASRARRAGGRETHHRVQQGLRKRRSFRRTARSPEARQSSGASRQAEGSLSRSSSCRSETRARHRHAQDRASAPGRSATLLSPTAGDEFPAMSLVRAERLFRRWRVVARASAHRAQVGRCQRRRDRRTPQAESGRWAHAADAGSARATQLPLHRHRLLLRRQRHSNQAQSLAREAAPPRRLAAGTLPMVDPVGPRAQPPQARARRARALARAVRQTAPRQLQIRPGGVPPCHAQPYSTRQEGSAATLRAARRGVRVA
jgi:hypothetical protein